MINGSIYLTCDKTVAMNFVAADPQNNIIICISQNVLQDQMFLQSTGALVANILTPSYDAFMMSVSGNQEGFAALYYDQLNRKECMEYIAVMLKAVSIGKNIILYLDPEEMQTEYPNMFRAYMAQKFGIFIGDQCTQFTYLINYYVNVAVAMYSFDCCTYQELFAAWRMVPSVELDDFVVMKLVNDIKPTVDHEMNLKEYQELFRMMAVGINGKQFEIPARLVKQ